MKTLPLKTRELFQKPLRVLRVSLRNMTKLFRIYGVSRNGVNGIGYDPHEKYKSNKENIPTTLYSHFIFVRLVQKEDGKDEEKYDYESDENKSTKH